MKSREYSDLPDAKRLDSWKEIAAHLGRSTRTVQRWEKEEGLPVYRRESPEDDEKQNQRQVFAYTTELDAWWRHFAGQAGEMAPPAAHRAERPFAAKYKHPLAIGAMAVVVVGAFIWQVERGASEAAAPLRPVVEKLREYVAPDRFWISPDGVHVAVVKAEDRGPMGGRGVWLETLDDSAAPKRLGKYFPGDLQWSADGDVVQFHEGVGNRRDCVQRLYRVSTASLETRPPEPWLCRQPPESEVVKAAKHFSRRELEDGHTAVDLVDPATGESIELFHDWMRERGGFQLSPDGRAVAYNWRRDGNTDIYMQNLPDGEPIRVTSDPAGDSSPMWSPDGGEIAFLSSRAGHGLWRVPVAPRGATGRPTLLAPLVAYDLRRVQLTLDGSLIYVNRPPREQMAVIPLHAATGAAMGPELPDFGPDSWFRSWRDGGKTLRYSKAGPTVDRDMASGREQSVTVEQRKFPSQRGTVIYSNGGEPIIFVGWAKDGVRGFFSFNEDFTELRLIRKLPPMEQGPITLSPDGTEILMGQAAGPTPEAPGQPYAVLAFRIADGELRELVRSTSQPFARWSPDGSAIAYTDGGCLMVVPRGGGESREVTCGPDAQGRELRLAPFNRGYLAWSPDGGKIAWTINDLDRQALDIRVVDVATGAYHVLWTGESGYKTEPRFLEWAPSGDYLEFQKRFQERWEVWRLTNIWPRARTRLSD